MTQDIDFDSLLIECEAFGKTREFGYSRLTKRYEPKGFHGVE